MRAYLHSHDLNPYNRQHVFYYMKYMPSTEDARSLVDDIAAKGKGLVSPNQAVDSAAWAYEQWQTFTGSSDFMDVVLAVSKGEMSPELAQNLTGHYSARGFEGVMYYLQDLASRVKK